MRTPARRCSPGCQGPPLLRGRHIASSPVVATSGLDALRARMHELKDLGGTIGLLTWDQETYPAARPVRREPRSSPPCQGLYHQRLVAPEVGDWLDAAERTRLADDDRAMLSRLPPRARPGGERCRGLVRPGRGPSRRGSMPGGWRGPSVRFDRFAPALQRLLELRRAQADAVGTRGERYDALSTTTSRR